MTGDPDDLKARAQHAFDRSTVEGSGAFYGPVHPDTLAAMERALRSLPRLTREVFLAHRLDGFSYVQIADVTGLSVRQVERRMAAAIIRISDYMRGDERTPWQRWRHALLARWRR